MSVVGITEAKVQLAELIERALGGEEIIISKRKQPLVKLAVVKQHCNERPVRRFGGLKHLVISMGDSFNDPIDFSEEQREHEGSKVAEDTPRYGSK
jgi:prevent-host-death family protein